MLLSTPSRALQFSYRTIDVLIRLFLETKLHCAFEPQDLLSHLFNADGDDQTGKYMDLMSKKTDACLFVIST